MTRLAIMAPKTRQQDVIEALHDSRLAHIEAFTAQEEDELAIGDPLEQGSEASEILVRLRSTIHTLGLEDEAPETRLAQSDIRSRIQRQLPGIEEEVDEAVRERNRIESELDDRRARIEQLEPIRELPLDLEDYRGYDSLEVFLGLSTDELRAALSEELERFEVFRAGEAQAVFVAHDEADEAQEILTREGFQQLEIPQGEGTPEAQLTRLRNETQDLARSLADVQAEIDELAEEHKDLLLCAEEDLSITVEKAEAPLDFASTERTFVVDAWVPTEDIDTLKTIVGEATAGQVHFEALDEGGREVHDRQEEPPTRYDHPTGVAPFAFLMDTFSRPRYDEIDPTIILTIVFPLFLGFMIGDLGYGILMIALGYYLYKAVGPKSPAARSLGFALLLAGGWASLFGGIIFKDALGIPLYAAHGGELSWPGLLGLHGGAGDPVLHKLAQTGVKSMLALSILAAFVHLFVGFIFGFINHLGHDTKHAMAQIGWIVTLAGLALLSIVMGPANAVSGYLIEGLGLGTVEWFHGHVEAIHVTGFGSTLPWYLLAPGVGILVLTEGLMGVMETFSLLSNIISYTRLAGVGVAKGAMALAFNGIFLEDMALHGEGAILIVVGFILFVLAQMIVFVLGLISSGIQGIRLNYVEFFLKFFQGGGEIFSPFGRERKFTTTTE